MKSVNKYIHEESTYAHTHKDTHTHTWRDNVYTHINVYFVLNL